MLQAVILVCAIGSADCTRDNALDVLMTPIRSANPSTCFLQGQAYLAETSLDVRPGDHVKIICPRAR